MSNEMPQGVESNIIIFCSDPRVVKWLYNDDVRKKLSIDVNYSAIAQTGSIKFFMHEGLMDKLFKQLEILVGHFKPEKIIILNHSGCGYYKSINEDREEIYQKDLKDSKTQISSKFSDVEVQGWMIDTQSGELKKA